MLKASGQSRLWGWLNVVDRPESALFPGLALITVLTVGIVLAWSTAARGNMQRLRATRMLLAGAIVFGLVAATPLWLGPWKIDVFGIRLLSVRTPHKPFSVAVLLAVVALRAPPVDPRRVGAAIVAGVLHACGSRDVAVLPRTGADPDGTSRSSTRRPTPG